MKSEKKTRSGKLIFAVVGGGLLVTGITLVIVWWPQVVSLFRGFVGVALALGGMLMLYMAKEK